MTINEYEKRRTACLRLLDRVSAVLVELPDPDYMSMVYSASRRQPVVACEFSWGSLMATFYEDSLVWTNRRPGCRGITRGQCVESLRRELPAVVTEVSSGEDDG